MNVSPKDLTERITKAIYKDEKVLPRQSVMDARGMIIKGVEIALSIATISGIDELAKQLKYELEFNDDMNKAFNMIDEENKDV